MKALKILMSAITGLCLIGASGSAMADNTCEDGWITGVVDEDIVISGGPLASCVIDNATVNGNITATGAADLTIQFAQVQGKIKAVDGESAIIFASTAQNIRVLRNTVAVLLENVVNENIEVNRNEIARLRKNFAAKSITCNNNKSIKASGNSVGPLGTEDCGVF